MAKRLELGIDQVRQVIHCADIHIRNVKRHKEFRSVFERFYTQLDELDLSDTIIYLGGDIAHSKTDMSPELVREISMFLTEVSSRAPTLLILGNHDCSLNNSNRLDVLTPIVESLNLPNLYYMRDNETILVGDTSFTVFSILQSPETYPDLLEDVPEAMANKIVFFHGPVHQSMTDVGYTITNRSITTEMFDGYDIAMLGDIHRHQVLQEQDPKIVYVGSFVQQNHGESLDMHGFLVWDIPSRTFEHHEVINDYGYATLYIEHGKLIEDIDFLPKKPRLRIRVVKTDASTVKDIIKKIKKKYQVDELTTTRIDTLDDITEPVSKRLSIGDVSDVNYQNRLIEEYLTNNYIVDRDDIQKIFDINQQLNLQLSETDVPRNVLWSPIRFTFSNMFSYGEDNVIDFSNMRDLLGLFAPNTSGKSSIADAISFCLFDKTSRAFKAIDIMNTRKDSFECCMEFDINGVRYFVEKRAKRIRDNVRVDVEFWYQDDDGEKIFLNGPQRRDTNGIIRQYVGDYETFVLTTLSVQGKNSQFIDRSQSERKDLLSEFIGTSIFDRLYNLVYDEVKGLKSSLKRVNKDILTDQIVDLEKRLSVAKRQQTMKGQEYEGLIQEKESLTEDLIELNQSLVEIDKSIVDVDSLKHGRDGLKEQIVELEAELEGLKSSLESHRTEHGNLQSSMKNMLASNVESRFKHHNNLLGKIKDVSSVGSNLVDQIRIKKDRLGKVESMTFDANCDVCMDNERLVNSEASDLRVEIVHMEGRLLEAHNLLDEYEAELDSTVEDEHTAFQSTKSALQSKEMQILKTESRLQSIESEIAKSRYELDGLKTKIDQYYKSEKEIRKNKELSLEIVETKDTITNLNELIESTNADLIRLTGEISASKARIEELEDKIQDVTKIEDDLRLYELYLKSVKRDGIPYELISKVIPVIEAEINNILQHIVDFGIVLHMDGKNINAHLVYNDNYWLLDLASGMERFVAGLAIRIALMNVCNLPRSNFLIIDEGMGTLDSDNVSTFYLVFDYLKTQFDFIIMISHLDSARDMTDDLIEVKKDDNGFSSVSYV